MDGCANEEQARRWNGDSGRRWIAERERHASLRQRLIPQLLGAASIAPGARVLDVGCGCGEMTLEAARRAQPGGSVLGLDLSVPGSVRYRPGRWSSRPGSAPTWPT